MQKRKFIGEILLDLGYIKDYDLQNILSEQKKLKNDDKLPLIGELLIEKNIITRKQLKEALKHSLLEIINDKEAKDFIKESTISTLKTLEKEEQEEQMEKTKLSEESKMALTIRYNFLVDKMEKIKKSLMDNQNLAQTNFRKILIQNYKNELIELEKKIIMLKNDIEQFC
ncbi:MAG: hypothetical protein A2086_16840 [Spirochaetes bacterium GWD1_27_9]|nr:MAG: hypothetical protein A2Z98_02290 [Spirochaetes bacterium GWB1_27_13]OHD23312.1 MAG: hypothetical protein A2Y34_11610 [Spirochaetes bacterium GWC1_27_15]OHD32312.1 MAG: hypothetical protein A2086_16840 [Spirochaetes bacterium GWD1_27_9]